MTLTALVLALAMSALAHPGGVDAEGCHKDSAAGRRHCHPERAAGAKATGAPAVKEEFSGKVVSVKDGDTVEVMKGGKAVRVRLAEVDAPEKSQAFGTQAKKFLSDLVFGKAVSVRVSDTDRYGRSVAHLVLSDGRDVNRELLKAGMAWWYKSYSKDESLKALQDEARAARRGLWADPAPVEPWSFRRKAGGRV